MSNNTELKAFIERIERMEEEINNNKEDRKAIYDEAKGVGYDTKILRKVIALRRLDASERERIQAEIDTYMDNLG